MKLEIIKYFSLCICFSFFLNCQNNKQETKDISVKPSQGVTTSEVRREGNSALKIYDDFSKLEHRFQTESDSVFIINFWATWCKPCVAELPYFFELEEKYKNKKVGFLYVSLDFKKQIDKKLKPFLEKREIKSEVVALTDPDSNTWIDKVSPEWSGAIPASFIFSKNKKGFYEKSFESTEELEELLKTYLN